MQFACEAQDRSRELRSTSVFKDRHELTITGKQKIYPRMGVEPVLYSAGFRVGTLTGFQFITLHFVK